MPSSREPWSNVLRIVPVHTRYRIPGGEESVVEAERALLAAAGHEVHPFDADNVDLDDGNPLRLAADTVWNRRKAAEFREFLAATSPDVVHFHNTFPLLSPAVVREAHAAGVATVVTLHNYRLACVNGLLLRDGRPCDACVGRLAPWPGVIHGCYRDSRAASAVVATMLGLHRAVGTWSAAVDRFLVPSAYVRERVVASGLDAARVVVRPHGVPSFGVEPSEPSRPNFVLFAGRMAPEKGLALLLQGWGGGIGGAVLRVAGDGPLRASVQGPAVESLGRLDRVALRRELARAWCVVVPSLAAETFGLVAAEAAMVGVPAVVTRVGGLPEVVEDGVSGLVVEPEAASLRAALERLLGDESLRAKLADGAWRGASRFGDDAALSSLLAAYEGARSHRRRRPD